jgi:hypothetical protein
MLVKAQQVKVTTAVTGITVVVILPEVAAGQVLSAITTADQPQEQVAQGFNGQMVTITREAVEAAVTTQVITAQEALAAVVVELMEDTQME